MSLNKTNIVVKRNSILAKMACQWMRTKAVAMVWGRTIHLYGAEPKVLLTNKAWLAHELVHVKQYEVRGIRGFLMSYLWECVKHGYYNNRYEKEARETNNHLDWVAIFENYNFKIK